MGNDKISANDALLVTIKFYKELQVKNDELQAENKKLRDCVEYIKASHRCICNNCELIPCSRCMSEKTLTELKDKQ